MEMSVSVTSPAELKGVTFVQVDEVVTGSQKGVFRRFFEEHLPSFAGQFEFLSDNIEKNGKLPFPSVDIS